MAKLVKGETFKLDLDLVADSVTVTVAGPTKVSGTATPDGGVFKYRLDTSGLQVGLYAYEVFAVKDGETSHVLRDTFMLGESLSSAPSSNYDATSDQPKAAQMVEMIQACIAGNASEGVKSYQINGRSLERYSIAELLELLNYYKNEAAMEARKLKGRSVLGPRIEFRI